MGFYIKLRNIFITRRTKSYSFIMTINNGMTSFRQSISQSHIKSRKIQEYKSYGHFSLLTTPTLQALYTTRASRGPLDGVSVVKGCFNGSDSTANYFAKS